MLKSLKITLVTCFIAALFGGCNNNNNQGSKVIARVHSKNLHISDISDIFPKNISKSDSIQILKAYVDRWVRKQLMLARAEQNLSESQKNVSQQIEDYRSSLLVFKYEQEIIRQKLDTVIPYLEVEKFYKENSSNFLLNETIVKALFLKVKNEDQNLEKIRGLYKSTKENDIKSIDNIAYQTAVKYDYFNDKWIRFETILRELPQQITNPEGFLNSNRNFEMKDENFSYFVSVREMKFRGQLSPLEFEHQNIQNILLNKRKQSLIIDLETKIFNDARNHNQFVTFLD
jgi:DNA polymerase III epsilon subunit-like protein